MFSLEVFLGTDLAGYLSLNSEREWTFVYADDFLNRSASGPISLALPRRQQTHRGERVRAVFDNLLPDGALRQRLMQALGLSAGADFALLGHLGRECFGGLRLRPPGESWIETEIRPLKHADVRNLAAVLPVRPMLADAEEGRKTLPGEFDKLPLRIAGEQLNIVAGDGATTHIVKTAKPGLAESVMNEAYVSHLATAMGLPMNETRVIHGHIDVLAITRFDRSAEGQWRHAEDLAQIMGYVPPYKYEREGGPRLSEIADLLRRVSIQPALDLRALVKWLVFSVLVGFGAAHAKQLALLHTSRGPKLAPFYGLWSTHVYTQMNTRMGYRIGHEDRPDWLTVERWRECAAELKIRPRYLLELLTEFAATLPRIAAATADEFQRRHGYAATIRNIRVLIEQRSRHALVAIAAEQPDKTKRV